MKVNNKYEDYNKIIVYECVKYYSMCQEHQCKIMQDVELHIKRYKNWYRNEWEAARNNAHPQIRNYARTYEENKDNLIIEKLKILILRLKEFCKGVRPLVQNNIQIFFG